MISDYIGGGQVFLHKVRMLRQVIGMTILVAVLAGGVLSWYFNRARMNQVDWSGAITHAKADMVLALHPVLSKISISGKTRATIDAYSNGQLWKRRMLARSVITSPKFTIAWRNGKSASAILLWQGLAAGIISGLLLFFFWRKFGLDLKTDRKKEGSGSVLSADKVNNVLKKLNKNSDLTIGKMCLVKDMETRHFLVTGATGSGKTNLFHNMLPQIRQKQQPAIIIDQTGEMIAKYYDPRRGDIIFNPFDNRTVSWDFWEDCSTKDELERFSKILIGFNRKQSGSHSDPFWENAAEAVFNSCIEFLRPRNATIEDIANMVCHTDINYLKTVLASSEAARYLGADSKHTAASILAVLSAGSKPLTYLTSRVNVSSFSMKQHFNTIKHGSDAWLFLATKPSNRNLTLPLIACLTELALASLMEIGVNPNRRIWTIIDELPALGKLPALSSLMAEGRKYGACVIAGMQSLNQLYSNYGHYDGSTIFGQFGTSFFFRNSEPAIAKMVSTMCGMETITRHAKNTSFGANEFRDGVSYNEQQQRKALVEPEDLASLAVGECYTLLPEPKVRLSKMQTPEANIQMMNEGFIPQESSIDDSTKESPTIFNSNNIIDSATGTDVTQKPLRMSNKNTKEHKEFSI